ncbi:hypothetical protein [Streptomyces sp. NPDC046805]|uniref:hypothetical protein n=1 Tax=Streptomyces sp. NPDC046805 TaxID=3155134 RepID=UPI00340B7E6C
MALEKSSPRPRHRPEGCLVVAIRVPVRIVALVLVVPLRLVWDALVVAGRLLTDTVLRPVGRALARLGRVLVVVPVGWLYRYLLTPVGHGVAWLLKRLVVLPARWLYERILAPVGRALAWLVGVVGVLLGTVLCWTARVLVVLPALTLWRWVLAPVARVLAVVAEEAGEALGHAWRVAGHVSRAVGRFLGTLFRWTFVEPGRWVHRTVLTPVGHVVRDAVLRPVAEVARAVGRATGQTLDSARETVRQARADVRRMLLGEPVRPGTADRRELPGAGTRTLGSRTTALTKD